MTAFDILFNPLRAEHPFENWSPREISKFQACMLMYGKNFGDYKQHVSLLKPFINPYSNNSCLIRAKWRSRTSTVVGSKRLTTRNGKNRTNFKS